MYREDWLKKKENYQFKINDQILQTNKLHK